MWECEMIALWAGMTSVSPDLLLVPPPTLSSWLLISCDSTSVWAESLSWPHPEQHRCACDHWWPGPGAERGKPWDGQLWGMPGTPGCHPTWRTACKYLILRYSVHKFNFKIVPIKQKMVSPCQSMSMYWDVNNWPGIVSVLPGQGVFSPVSESHTLSCYDTCYDMLSELSLWHWPGTGNGC